MKRQSGMSLVEVMIVVALISTGLVMFMSMMSEQQKQSSQLTDKLASLDLERALSIVLTGPSVCTYMTSVSPFAFDPMNLTGLATPPFAQIPSQGAAGAVPALLATAGALASPMSPRLVANSIVLTNFRCATLPCTPTSNQFNADLLVSFDTTQTGPLAPISIPMNLVTAGPANAQTITSCSRNTGVGGGGGPVFERLLVESVDSCGGSLSHPLCAVIPPDVFATCPNTHKVVGCGYRTTIWNPIPSGSTGFGNNNLHTNSPDNLVVEGNGCKMDAGGAPGCGVCFKAQAICLRFL